MLYDALIDRQVLKLARRAQRFFVGKRAGRRAMSQQTINALMIRAARRGKRVVRLKGGDPFVFGRGGEEALALQAAGVSVEIVPGVTSAVAAPALAGIPVTHRGVSSAFLVVGGHDLEAFASAIDTVAPNDLTLVVLMGVGRRAALARRLIDRGWHRRDPGRDCHRRVEADPDGLAGYTGRSRVGARGHRTGRSGDDRHRTGRRAWLARSGEFGHLVISSIWSLIGSANSVIDRPINDQMTN